MTDVALIEEKAYAKINPFLDVLGRREDGYHNLLSCMQAVTLCDSLHFFWKENTATRTELRLLCADARVPTGEDNLILRAGRAFLAALGDRAEKTSGVLTVELVKNIPMAAGLAGGSADAAAMLRGMNRLFGEPFSAETLCKIGTAIGADVPFCVRCREGAMRAEGIGERLSPMRGLPPETHLLILCRGEGVPTPWAYRKIDGQTTSTADWEAFTRALEGEDLAAIGAASYNAFEKVVFPERPVARELYDRMAASGAAFVRMSGSGPSIIGYFPDEQSARRGADALRAQGESPLTCRPLPAGGSDNE